VVITGLMNWVTETDTHRVQHKKTGISFFKRAHGQGPSLDLSHSLRWISSGLLAFSLSMGGVINQDVERGRGKEKRTYC